MYRHKPTIEVFKKRWVLLTSDEQREEALLEYRTRKNERVSVRDNHCDEPHSVFTNANSLHVHARYGRFDVRTNGKKN